jgi:hypothetical protein
MRPQSIIRFDQFYLGALALGIVNFALGYDAALAQMEADPAAAELGMAGPGFMFGVFGFSMAISLLLWWLTSRRASNGARWVLAVLGVIGVISIPFSLGQMALHQQVVTVIVTLVQIGALWFLFRPDANAWFRHGTKGMDPDVFE